MLVHEIIDKNITPLKVTDSVALALTKLDLLFVTRFPVVNDGELIGMVSLDTLIEADNEELKISALSLQDNISIPESQHLFEAARTMLAHEQFILPVVDHEQRFVGVIKKREVLQALGDVFNLESFGSVITIEMMPYDFTLTEVIRLIETEQAKVLGVAVEQPNDNYGFYRVSIKLNMEDSSNVCSTLQRYGYVVTSQVSSATMERDLSERADELIRYLDI
ncbi:MAG: CBS domain-containing protein [Balneolaceae bacterium]|nr:CBS domain-containing protein [Balneolaceae bacterium]MCR9134000.1 CBS domain-containing protein [bacterium]